MTVCNCNKKANVAYEVTFTGGNKQTYSTTSEAIAATKAAKDPKATFKAVAK